MNGLGDGTSWSGFGLDTVSNPEDLDARLEAALESRGPVACGAVATLAARLGMETWALRRLAGVPIAAEVAAARLRLLDAACEESRARALAFRGDDDARRLRQAVAVCAALQWESLGDVDRSGAAFACRDRPRFGGGFLAAAVCEAVPRGRTALLARIRLVAIAGAASEAAAAIAC